MKRMLACCFCGLLVFTSPSLAEDAAISVCEAVLKSELKTPKSYERVEAVVNGSSVFISYDAVNLYNAPIRSGFECEFAAGPDGKFGLASKIPEDLEAEVSSHEGRAKSAKTLEAVEEVQAENRRLIAEVKKFAVREILQILTAKKTGLYPIDPEKTALSEK